MREITRTDWHSLPSECWPFEGAITSKGYGRIYIGGRHVYAHRFAYLLTRGPIPAGLQIDHLCRNRRCVNPAHLEVVTNRENVRRGKALITHCPAGHEYTPENTRVRRGARECRACRSRW